MKIVGQEFEIASEEKKAIMKKALFMQIIQIMKKVRIDEKRQFNLKYGGMQGYRPYWELERVIELC